MYHVISDFAVSHFPLPLHQECLQRSLASSRQRTWRCQTLTSAAGNIFGAPLDRLLALLIPYFKPAIAQARREVDHQQSSGDESGLIAMPGAALPKNTRQKSTCSGMGVYREKPCELRRGRPAQTDVNGHFRAQSLQNFASALRMLLVFELALRSVIN